MEFFISDNSACLRFEFEANNDDVSNVNFYCYVGKRFGQYLRELHSSTDGWLRACSFFIRTSKDCFTFIRSYCTGDSIGVEIGYQGFAPFFRVNGQYRYLERHWRQQEEMLELNAFTKLEGLRRNRQVNHYHGSCNKNMITIDEMLELANRFLSQFPKMRSRASFAKQANQVGSEKMCKIFIVMLSGLATQVDVTTTYRSGTAPKTIPEKKLIYELFSVAGTATHQINRMFHSKFVVE